MEFGVEIKRYGATSSLPLDEDVIQKMLCTGMEKPPTLVFVCRRFDSTTLYEKWLGKEPGFYVLSDFSQPSYALQARGPMSYPERMGQGSQMETLRSKFALPENGVCAVLVDGKGTVLYVDGDAAGRLEQVLTAIKERVHGTAGATAAGPAPQPGPGDAQG